MPIWVDGRWVMRSPITEYGRSGDTTNIIALSRVPDNPGWTDDPCVISNFYGRYRSKSISNSTHDVADETVAEKVDAEDIASQLHNNTVHIMNKRERTNEHKLKIIQINREDRQKDKNFTKRIKQRWDINFRKRKERRKTCWQCKTVQKGKVRRRCQNTSPKEYTLNY